MSVIPVIDMAAGQVVRAIAGDRDNYQPIREALVASTDPSVVATAMCDAVGSHELYVADIGAYQGRSRDWTALKLLGNTCAAAEVEVMIDFGIINAIDAISAFEMLDQTVKCDYKLILALESMEEMSELEMITDAFAKRTLFSIDLHGGQLRTNDPAFDIPDPVGVANYVIERGIQELIVLDTADVGSETGCSALECIREIGQGVIRKNPDVALIGGGGVRGRDDVQALLAAGCRAALVSTAIHNGRIRMERP